MTGGTKEKAPARRRGKPIEVWVTDKEKAAITERADEAGMSRSGYFRALGLNTPIRSVVGLTAVADLAKVNGDLGRVAGLLKLWLAEKIGQGAEPVDVEKGEFPSSSSRGSGSNEPNSIWAGIIDFRVTVLA